MCKLKTNPLLFCQLYVVIHIFLFAVCKDAIATADINLLIQNGQEYFANSDYENAIIQWESALDQNPSIDESAAFLFKLTVAYQAMGYHETALNKLSAFFSDIEAADNLVLKIKCSNRMADIYLSLGHIEDAVKHAKTAQADAQQLTNNKAVQAPILITIGNILVADEKYNDALLFYQDSLAILMEKDVFIDKKHRIMAGILLNIARVHAELEDVHEAIQFILKAKEAILKMTLCGKKAEMFISLGFLIQSVQPHFSSNDPLARLAFFCFEQARRIAGYFHINHLESYAYGCLGTLYENNQQLDQAITYTQNAIFYSQQGHHPEIQYRWLWQMGRIYRVLKDNKKAKQYYQKAIHVMTPIRHELFSGYRFQKETFDQWVRPVYMGLAELYLSDAASEPHSEQLKNNAIRKAIDIVETLKTAELQNYYEDRCLVAAKTEQSFINYQFDKTAIVYPIALPQELIIMLGLPGGYTSVSVPVEGDTLKQAARKLRRQLVSRTSKRFVYHARKLYDWLIRPIESVLQKNDIQTLIVAPDGALRLIPFSALMDDKTFLIEKYALGTIPAFQLTNFDQTSSPQSDILLCGLSESVQDFPPLPGVAVELSNIQEIMDARVVLKDQTYTIASVKNELQTNPYSIIHLATHGIFGGTPENSYLLTYHQKLTMNMLEQLILSQKLLNRKVDLLTLSACQTAMGNERAALGLAGVAVKAGVKSAIATLWYVDDEATSMVITEFYKQLRQPGMLRAMALQNAQKTLIKEKKFWHPIYWAPFLLIGNWM